MKLTAFDVMSSKAKQFGYRLRFPNRRTLVCLGDEPYDEHNRVYAERADWLLSEAFCRHADRDRFEPYEKHHSTVKEAAQRAESLQVKHLVLYHTEDETLPRRKALYTEEAQEFYHGPIYVPDDLEVIDID